MKRPPVLVWLLSGLLVVVGLRTVFFTQADTSSGRPCYWGGQSRPNGSWALPNGDKRFVCRNGIWQAGVSGGYGGVQTANPAQCPLGQFCWTVAYTCQQFGSMHLNTSHFWVQSPVASDARCAGAADSSSTALTPASLPSFQRQMYVVGPVSHFTAGIVSKTTVPTTPSEYKNLLGDGIMRLSWDQYVDPRLLPSGSDIYFQLEKKVLGVDKDFVKISVFIPSVSNTTPDGTVFDIPGTVSTVYDVVNATTALKGRTIQYRMKTLGSTQVSGYASAPDVAIKAVDLAVGPLRMLPTDTVCARFAVTIRNEGYTAIATTGQRFAITKKDDSGVGTNAGFVGGVGIVQSAGMSTNTPALTVFNPGDQFEHQEWLCTNEPVVEPYRSAGGPHTFKIIVNHTKDGANGPSSVTMMKTYVIQDGQLGEDTDTNNTASLTIIASHCGKDNSQWCLTDPNDQPDLSIEQLTSNIPYQGKQNSFRTGTYSYLLYNRGTKPVPANTPITIEDWVDGEKRATNVTPFYRPLAVNDSVPFQSMVQYNPSFVGVGNPTHTIEIKVNTTKSIPELRWDNNDVTIITPAVAYGTTCGGVSVWLPSDANNCGECGYACAPTEHCEAAVCKYGRPDLTVQNLRLMSSTKYAVDIKNLSDYPQQPTPVNFLLTIDGQSQTVSWNIDQPLLWNSKPFTVSFGLPSGFKVQDPHKITLTLDPDKKLLDQDRSNNIATLQLGTQAIVARLQFDGSRLSLVGKPVPVTANVPVVADTQQGTHAYHALLDNKTADGAAAHTDAYFDLPVDQRLTIVNNAINAQPLGGKKVFPIALPLFGTPQRLRITAVGQTANLIDVSFDAQGNVK